jgi:hypothetical protein
MCRYFSSLWQFISVWLPLSFAGPVAADVAEVVVGITPSCPYGISACWPAAAEALRRLEGVESVEQTPDSYNCTAHIYLRHGRLPPVRRWREQFANVVGEIFEFRGVELTISGSLVERDGTLLLDADSLEEPLRLTALRNKLQWHFRKQRARGAEPEEEIAHAQLVAACRRAEGKPLNVEVTGPLVSADSQQEFHLEVREFFITASKSDSN